MNPKVYSYTGGKTVSDGDMPPDPLRGDLCIHRVAGDTVYSVLPMTQYGRAFVVSHHEAGTVHGDLLLVPQREIFPFMNEVFDAGVKVV